MIVIENDAGQVLELVLSGVVRVNTTPADAMSEMLRVRDQGYMVHETESPTLIGTLLEYVPPTTPFEALTRDKLVEEQEA